MNQDMILEQRQTLNLTPQMRQSIKILQMNSLELRGWLGKEIQDNPALELLNDYPAEKDPVPDFKAESNETIRSEKSEKEECLFGKNSHRITCDNRLNISSEEKKWVKEKGEERQNTFYRNLTLQEHLLMNFRIMVRNPVDYKLGEYLIGHINENGYLVISCREIAEDLKISEKRVLQVLAMIQNSSISGLGARNLRECLLLQLKSLKIEHKKVIRVLISRYLNELAHKKYQIISKELGLSCYEIQKLHDMIIKNFDPKPGRLFVQKNILNFLIPDLIVKEEHNKYEIVENNFFIPSIRINSLYEKILLTSQQGVSSLKYSCEYLLNQEDENKKTIHYLEKRIQSGRWIIQCLEKRRKTILSIAKTIIDYQQDFIKKGILYLKPLSMASVADALGLHESTVSRAVNCKTIQLPSGLYEMKFFFSRGLFQSYDNRIVSNEKIKRLIKNIIEKEDPVNPYSDQLIVTRLKNQENIQIARRTVAKYREMMSIESAKNRKRYQVFEEKR